MTLPTRQSLRYSLGASVANLFPFFVDFWSSLFFFLSFRFHFDALAHDNDALSSAVEDVHTIPNDRGDRTPSVIILRGKQGVRKFNLTSVDDVRIFMALYRVEEKGVDLVLTLNFPMSVGDGNTRIEEQYAKAQSDFYSIATSLRIVDFDLFA